MIRDTAVLLFLWINAMIDARKQEISMISVLIVGIFGLGWTWMSEGSPIVRLPAMAPGILMACLSIVSGEAVGLGDAWILCAMGTVMEPDEVLQVLIPGSVLCGMFSGLFLILRHGAGKETRIPFVPFLLAGYVGGMLL